MNKSIAIKTEVKVCRCIAIGDPHFSKEHLAISAKFADDVVKIVQEKQPKFVVVLGDLLHEMDESTVQPHKLASQFLKRLGRIAPTYLIIGNHDLMNETQFLTDNHFFTVFHGVESVTGVTIVDKPLIINPSPSFHFVLCPYVPKGRFKEALDTLGEVEWNTIDAIFAHQEFAGVMMNSAISNGDPWPPVESEIPVAEWPPVVSGHIHESQILEGGVYYTGSAMQHTFAESHKKGIWEIRFRRSTKRLPFTHEVVETCLKNKVTKTLTAEEAILISHERDPVALGVDLKNGQSLKIRIEETQATLESLQKTGVVKSLESMGVVVVLEPTDGAALNHPLANLGLGNNFWEIFRDLVQEAAIDNEDPKLIEEAEPYLN